MGKVYDVSVMLIFSLMIRDISATQQQLIFYDDLACTGRNETVTTVSPDLDTTWMANATSVRVIGLWSISLARVISGSTISFNIIHNNAQPPNGVCANKMSMIPEPEWEEYRFATADYYGPTDLTTPQITFFSKWQFRGMRYHLTEDTAHATEGPWAMLAMAQFSNATWLVYPEHNYGGIPTCLRSSSRSEDQFTHDSQVIIVVGSVKKSVTAECPANSLSYEPRPLPPLFKEQISSEIHY